MKIKGRLMNDQQQETTQFPIVKNVVYEDVFLLQKKWTYNNELFTQAITYAICAALLIALPSLLTVSGGGCWGNSPGSTYHLTDSGYVKNID
jgi:hypothetical protein